MQLTSWLWRKGLLFFPKIPALNFHWDFLVSWENMRLKFMLEIRPESNIYRTFGKDTILSRSNSEWNFMGNLAKIHISNWVLYELDTKCKCCTSSYKFKLKLLQIVPVVNYYVSKANFRKNFHIFFDALNHKLNRTFDSID